MKKIVARHLAKLHRDLADPARIERLRERIAANAYPPAPPPGAAGARDLRVVRQERIPISAPDWYFEQELRRSGLWAMMEACYPTRQAQCQ
jgi:hypothetical protein